MTTRAEQFAAFVCDAENRIAEDVPCVNCAYNLRTLSADGDHEVIDLLLVTSIHVGNGRARRRRR